MSLPFGKETGFVSDATSGRQFLPLSMRLNFAFASLPPRHWALVSSSTHFHSSTFPPVNTSLPFQGNHPLLSSRRLMVHKAHSIVSQKQFSSSSSIIVNDTHLFFMAMNPFFLCCPQHFLTSFLNNQFELRIFIYALGLLLSRSITEVNP